LSTGGLLADIVLSKDLLTYFISTSIPTVQRENIKPFKTTSSAFYNYCDLILFFVFCMLLRIKAYTFSPVIATMMTKITNMLVKIVAVRQTVLHSISAGRAITVEYIH